MMAPGMKNMKARLTGLYRVFLAAYGRQGWWPCAACAGRKRPVPGRRGYHPGDYSLPYDAAGRFEVAVGAILTQNTAWKNVEQALAKLKAGRLLTPRAVQAAGGAELRCAIRSSGYYNQKVKKLKQLAAFFIKNRSFRDGRPPRRPELLSVWGVGPETADSILLYAFHRPVFVIDAYTRRLLSRFGWADGKLPYGEVQAMFHEHLPRNRKMFNEYHALIVEHAKRYCRKKPLCAGCPAGKLCPWPTRRRA
jgi:endonuclease-3 related protein